MGQLLGNSLANVSLVVVFVCHTHSLLIPVPSLIDIVSGIIIRVGILLLQKHERLAFLGRGSPICDGELLSVELLSFLFGHIPFILLFRGDYL